MIELVVALMIGGVLAAVAVQGFGEVQGGMGIRSARATFLSYHAHARALAVERGTLMRLTVNPVTQVVSIEVGCGGGGDILESRDFGEAYGVSIDTGGGILGVCMTPKGVASPNLNTFADETEISFVSGGDSTSLLLLPLGQVITP